MRKWLQWAERLYPRSWRARYGDEFRALLDDVEPTARQLADVLSGAARMHYFAANRYVRWGGVAAVCGLILSTAAAFRLPPQYISTAILRMTPHQDVDAAVNSLGVTTVFLMGRGQMQSIIQDPAFNLYPEERKRGVPVSQLADRMLRNLRITSSAARAAPLDVLISFEYSDPLKAQAVVARFVRQIEQETDNRRKVRASMWRGLARNDDPQTAGEDLLVVRAASLPPGTHRNRIQLLFAGSFVGLLAGLLGAILRPLGKRAWSVPGLAAAGGAIGIAVTLLSMPQYTASAVLSLTPPLAPRQIAGAAIPIQQIEAETLTTDSLSSILKKPGLDLYPQERARMPLDRLIARMRSNISIQRVESPFGQTSACRVSFTDPDPIKAAKVARSLVGQFESNHTKAMQARIAGGTLPQKVFDFRAGENLELLDPVRIPASTDNSRFTFPALGLSLGVLAGLFVAQRQ